MRIAGARLPGAQGAGCEEQTMSHTITRRCVAWHSQHPPGTFRHTFCGFLAIFDIQMYENLRRLQKSKKICHISNQHIESNKLSHDSQTAHATDRFKCILKRGPIPSPKCHEQAPPSSPPHKLGAVTPTAISKRGEATGSFSKRKAASVTDAPSVYLPESPGCWYCAHMIGTYC